MSDKEKALLEIEKLSKELREHQHLYYVESKPRISDLTYDQLLNRLIELETLYPDLQKEDSPSQRVGSDLSASFIEVAHTIPVLSLDKSYSDEQTLQWATKIVERTQKSTSFVVEEKIDGVSLVLYYTNGVLDKAVTRGNGAVGNDVTLNAKTIATIPLVLQEPLTMAVRGEVFLSKDDFELVNKEGEGEYANPRNLAAGVLRRLKSSETAQFPLKMFAYEAFIQQGEELHSHIESLKLLKRNGFLVNSSLGVFYSTQESEKPDDFLENLVVAPLEQLPTYIQQESLKRDSLSYEIDGLVIKVDDIALREQLGYTSHHPRWAIAYKFDAPESETILESIDVQVGRTGRITPVGRVKPVKVGNSVVSNVTLHNQSYIDMLELAIGDTVTIAKRGDVIPAVLQVVEKNELDNTTFHLPEKCPSCQTPLVVKGAHLFCPNEKCPDQVRGKIEFFVGRNQMDIEGFGPETVAYLMNKGLLNSISDIYSIDYASLIGEPGFQKRKVTSLQNAVQKSKERPFHTVLLSLGIPDVGKRAIELIVASGICHIDQLIDLAHKDDRSSLLQIKGIGEKIIDSLFNSLSHPHFLKEIELLKEHGLHFEELKSEVKEHQHQSFSNQTWVVTGSFTHFNPRSKVIQEIEQRGGKVSSSVSKQTTFLLAGEKAGSKLTKAISLQIPVIYEEDFIALLKEEEDE
ncbi:MAG: NAD-dependent DNA ligase LigA [Sphaerochaetaceae bacterium]|jgi:DNA ligase (NAD+)